MPAVTVFSGHLKWYFLVRERTSLDSDSDDVDLQSYFPNAAPIRAFPRELFKLLPEK